MSIASVRTRLQYDMREIRESASWEHLNLTCSESLDVKSPMIYWNMIIRGAGNSYWQNQEYDFQIQFSKRFPFEPPILHFPSSPLNKRSIKHPLIGRNGNLDLDCVSKDSWNCTLTVNNIIKEVQALFSTNPEYGLLSETEESFLFQLPEEPLFGLIVYLSLNDVLRLSETCKKGLVTLHSNNLWAKMYYSRCQVPAAVLYNTGTALLHAGPGPLREYTEMSRSFQWRHSREAYVRAHQCYQVVRHSKVPSVQSLAAGELSVLLPLAFPAEIAAARAQPWDDDDPEHPSQRSGQKRALSEPTSPQNRPPGRANLENSNVESLNQSATIDPPAALAQLVASQHQQLQDQPFNQDLYQQYIENLTHLQSLPHHPHHPPHPQHLHHPYHFPHHHAHLHHLHHQQQHGAAAQGALATFAPGTKTAYYAALKYRALRSCRLAQWLGGPDCITANIVHNYWNNMPVTFLQFLCSLTVSLGLQGTPRLMLAQQLQTEAALTARECSLRMRQVERQYQRLLSSRSTVVDLTSSHLPDFDEYMSAMEVDAEASDQMQWETYLNDLAVDASGDSAAPLLQDPSYNTKLPAEPVATAPALSKEGVSNQSRNAAGATLNEVFGGAAVDRHVLRTSDPAVRARLRLVQDLLRNNCARSASVRENCDNCEDIRTVSQDDCGYGPDLYDIVERLHELTIAFSYQFRDMRKDAKLDCLDQNSDWVEAVVLNRTKPALSPGANLFALDSKPSDAQVLLRAHYLLAEIKLRDFRHYALLFQQQLGAAELPQIHSAVDLPRPRGAPDAALRVTAMDKYHRGGHVRTWLCLSCTSLNHCAHGVCCVCSADSFCEPLHLRVSVSGSCMCNAEPVQAATRLDELKPTDVASASVTDASSSSRGPNGDHLSDEREFALFMQRMPLPGVPLSAPLMLSLFGSEPPTNVDIARERHNFVRLFPENVHALSSKGQRRLYYQWRHLRAAQPWDDRELVAPAAGPAPSTGSAPSASGPSQLPQEGATAGVAPPAHPAVPFERLHGSLVLAHVREALSPYFAFNSQQASSFLRQLCTTLEEEQVSEFRTAASFAVAGQMLSERRVPAINDQSSADLRDVLGAFSAPTAATLTVPQLLGSAVPFTLPWPATRPNLDCFVHAYWDDVHNNRLRYQGIHGTAFAAEQALSVRYYDAFNLTRRWNGLYTITAHFPGYDSQFDERVSVTSARLAPYRTHTSRAQSLCIGSVGELLLRAQDRARGVSSARHSQSVANQSYPFDLPGSGGRARHRVSAQRRQRELAGGDQSPVPSESAASGPDTEVQQRTEVQLSATAAQPMTKETVLEIKLRCMWLCAKPGGGIVSYRVPASMALLTLVKDCCDVLGLNLAQVKVALVDMIHCARYAFERRIHSTLQSEWSDQATSAAEMPGVMMLDTSCALEELPVTNNSVIDILYRPLKDEYFV